MDYFRIANKPGVIASWLESKCRVRPFLQVALYAARYVRLLRRGCTMKCIRWGALLACLGTAAESFCVLVLSGCVGVTRLPTRTNGPTGATIQKNDIELTFLRAGTTRREEVVNTLSRIDTGYSNSRMFWGRWSESNWGVLVLGPFGGDASRNWHVHNLLVSFDENGVMQAKELTDDGKVVDSELRALLAKAPPLDLSQPVVITTTHGGYAYGNSFQGDLRDITLTKDGMLLSGSEISTLHRFRHNVKYFPVVKVPLLKVERISYDDNADAGRICHVLHLTEKTPIRSQTGQYMGQDMGKKILVCTSADDLATIFKYLLQAGPPNMRWE